ncbi:MAG TPA: hypothetical protein VFF94_05780, partial [Novosphingobium sp.]|nr:hypothetical protein [Novosphingobium sp.]
MSDPAFGAAFARQPDPTQETHYALSELAKYELDTLFAAMNTMGGILAEAPPDLDPLQVAPFFA